MAQEKEVNVKLIKTRLGEAIGYGTDIQLMHLDSGAFLQISKRSAEIQKDNLMIELTHDPSPNRVTFSIMPGYKYRQEGDKVIYGDHVVFKNMNKGLSISNS